MEIVLAETELIRAIACREPGSAVELYDLYATKLFKIICCSVNDLHSAEAVLEETMLFVWNNCTDCQLQNKPLLLWMAGVARQLAKKSLLR